MVGGERGRRRGKGEPLSLFSFLFSFFFFLFSFFFFLFSFPFSHHSLPPSSFFFPEYCLALQESVRRTSPFLPPPQSGEEKRNRTIVEISKNIKILLEASERIWAALVIFSFPFLFLFLPLFLTFPPFFQ